MKKIITIISCLLFSLGLLSQNQPDMVYRRSSLNVVFVQDYDNLGISERKVIDEIMASFPLPDKYNDHSIGDRVINVSSIQVNHWETEPYEKGFIGGLLNVIGKNVKATFGVVDDSEKDPLFIAKLNKYCTSHNIAGQSVAKWFNMSTSKIDGSYFNMDLIQERGAYNASELDILRSKESIRGEAILKDAGMDLIPNTFTVFIRLHYMTQAEWDNMMAKRYEESAKNTENRAAKATGEERNRLLNNASIDRNYASELRKAASTDKGYYVSATTYLYQLEWDENDVDIFLSNYYSDNPQNVINNGIYKMNYIDKANSQEFLTGVNSDEMQIYVLKLVTYWAIDKSFNKLQKKYEDFAVKTPIIDVENGIATVFIGTKEGITPKSKFEVLQLKYNETQDVFRYVRVGKLSVEKKKIWDNRYSSGYDDRIIDERIIEEEDTYKGNKMLDRTYLKGASSSIARGMIVRQIK